MPRYGQARDENWSHEEYLAALLQRQVADRESAGTIRGLRNIREESGAKGAA